jgi:methyl-accepting chemotaxis protein
MLLYHEGSFLQVLEGPPSAANPLFAVVAATSSLLLRQIKQQQEAIINEALPGITAAGQARFLVAQNELSILRHLVAKTPEEKEGFDNDIATYSSQAAKIYDDYRKTIARAEDKEQFERLMAVRMEYAVARTHLLELSRAGKDAEATEFLRSKFRPLYAAYIKELDGWFEENSKFSLTASAASKKTIGLANTLTVALTVTGISLGLIFSMVIVKGVNRVLNRVAGSLNDGSSQVSSAASQVTAASQTLAEGSSKQASSLEETGSSLEEMSSITKRNSENARKANELAKEARTAADRGVDGMQTMAAAMDAIKVSSDDIAKIIKTIDEIAFQTNILALNAAVEAARAGEAGMGFAVVADEVRNLAQRCAQAAKETSSKIEGAIAKTGQGVEISRKVAAALNEIVTKVRQVDELVTEVAGASREQTDGIAQINMAVGQMDKVTQSNAATAEESAAAAEELNAQAEVMKQSVANLLQLVGGKSESATRKPAAYPQRPTELRTTKAATPLLAAVSSNGNGNGHTHTEPELVTTGKRRGEIPMDGDFKDF